MTTARVTPRPTGACTAYRWTPKTGNRTLLAGSVPACSRTMLVGVPIRPVRIGLAGPLLVLAVRGRHALAALAVGSQNATLAPSATKRLTVASPIPDAQPVTAATLPSSLPMFVTFHRIAKRASTIRRIHPAGTALLARPGCPTSTGCGSFKRPLSGPFDGLTCSDLGRIAPLPLAWSRDRLRREGVTGPTARDEPFPRKPAQRMSSVDFSTTQPIPIMRARPRSRGRARRSEAVILWVSTSGSARLRRRFAGRLPVMVGQCQRRRDANE